MSRPPGSVAESLPALQMQPFVLARILDDLAGAERLTADALTWLACDPGVLADLFELAGPGSARSVRSLLEGLDGGHLKRRIVTASVKALSQSQVFKARDWLNSLACAHVCQGLAERLGGDDESAYLAGLFHNLDSFDDSLSGFQPRQRGNFARVAQWVQAWGRWPDLADALDAQTESVNRLRDALPLARMLRVARALAGHDGDAYQLAAQLLPQVGPDELDAVRAKAEAKVLDLRQKLAVPVGNGSLHEDGQSVRERLSAAVQSHVLIEQAEAAMAAAPDEAGAIGAARNFMTAQVGMRQWLYLHHDRSAGELSPLPEDADGYAGLRLQVEDSHAAAAWAASSRMPVIFSTDDPDSVSLFDVQLARRAGYGAVAAFPVGEFEIEGVVVGAVGRGLAAQWEADSQFLGRLGRVIGRRLRQVREQPATGAQAVATTRPDASLAKVRRTLHEVSNPLGIAKNYLAILGDKLGEQNPGADELRIIREELDRVPRILRTLIVDEPDAERVVEMVDVNAVIRDMVVIAESAIPPGKQACIRSRLEPALPVIRSDREKLKQLLLNLVLNAIDAVANDGQIFLETSRSLNHQGVKRLVIAVSDNGPGIPSDILKRLFEPVETTKGGQHAGLGLSIVKSLALDLDLEISCLSNASGTTFLIGVPLP